MKSLKRRKKLTLKRPIEQGATAKQPEAMMESSSECNDHEMNNDDNPQLIAISSVVQMFKQIQNEVKAVKTSQKQDLEREIRKVQAQTTQEISEAVATADFDPTEKKKMQAELAHWKHKSEVLTEVVDRMNVEIQDLTQRMENVELSAAKRSVTISGLDISTEKSNNWHMLKWLFEEVLDLEVQIDDFYTLGNNIIVAFQSMESKRAVMRVKNTLKKLKKSDNQQIYINDYLPPAVQEKRRRERDIVSLYNADASKLSYTKSGLAVHGVPYKKKVLPPTPKQLVNMEISDLERTLKLKIKKEAEITQDNSIFSAYTAEARSHSEIRDMFCKLKLCQPGARHIVCAYYIDHEEEHYAKDYHDDNEPGAGRVLLNLLVKNELKNRVIFVARKYGGIRMGADRFQCYAESAKAALIAHGLSVERSSAYKKTAPSRGVHSGQCTSTANSAENFQND